MLPKVGELETHPYRNIRSDRIRHSTEPALPNNYDSKRQLHGSQKMLVRHATKKSNLTALEAETNLRPLFSPDKGSLTERSAKLMTNTADGWMKKPTPQKHLGAIDANIKSKIPPVHLAFCNPLMGKKVKSDFMITAISPETQTPSSARFTDHVTKKSTSQRSATHRRNITQETELSSKTLLGIGSKEGRTNLKRISLLPENEQIATEDQGSRPELGVAQLFAELNKDQEYDTDQSSQLKARMRKPRTQSKSEHFSTGPTVGLSVPNLPMFEYYHVERKLCELETNAYVKQLANAKTVNWKMKTDRVQDQSLTTGEKELLAASPSNTSHTILSLVKATGAGIPARYDDSGSAAKDNHVQQRKDAVATRFGPGFSKYKNSRSVMNFQIKLIDPHRVRNVQLAHFDVPQQIEEPQWSGTDSKLKSALNSSQNPSPERQNSFQVELARLNLEDQYKLQQAHEKESPKMKVLSSMQHLQDLLKCLKELYTVYVNPNVSEEQYLIKVGNKLDEQIHLGLPSDSPLKGLFLKPDKTAFPSDYFTLSRLMKMIIRPNLQVEKFHPFWTQGRSSNQLSQFVTPIKMSSLKKGHTIEVENKLSAFNAESGVKNIATFGLSKSNLSSFQEAGSTNHLRQAKMVSFADLEVSRLNVSGGNKPKQGSANQRIMKAIKVKGPAKDRPILQSFSQDRVLQYSARLDTSHLNNSKIAAQEDKLCPSYCEYCSILGGNRTFCVWLNSLDDHNMLDEVLEHANNIEIDLSLLALLTKLVQNLTANLSAHHSSLASAQAAALTHRVSSIRKLTAMSLASSKQGLVVSGAVALEEPLASTARSLRRRELDLRRREDEVVHETGSRLHVWGGARDRLKAVHEVKSVLVRSMADR